MASAAIHFYMAVIMLIPCLLLLSLCVGVLCLLILFNYLAKEDSWLLSFMMVHPNFGVCYV